MGKFSSQIRPSQQESENRGNAANNLLSNNLLDNNLMSNNLLGNNLLTNNNESNGATLADSEKSAQTEITENTTPVGMSFYAASGEFLGMIGDGTEVRVVQASDVADVTEKVSWANDPSEHGVENAAYNTEVAVTKSVAMPINHTEFQKLSGLVSKEDHTNQETMNATAFAQRNRHAQMNTKGKTATVTEVFNTFGGSKSKDLHAKMIKNRPLYKTYWEKAPADRNTYEYGKKDIYVMAQAAVIEAWLHPENDNTNGATGWHGMDVLKSMPEVGHAYEDFQLKYGFKWDTDPKIGKGAKISKTNMPNHSGENGQVLYIISAAYGSSIYYKNNPSKK